MRTVKKAAIKREQNDARISSAEREQARLEVNGEEEVSTACILLFGPEVLPPCPYSLY